MSFRASGVPGSPPLQLLRWSDPLESVRARGSLAEGLGRALGPQISGEL